MNFWLPSSEQDYVLQRSTALCSHGSVDPWVNDYKYD